MAMHDTRLGSVSEDWSVILQSISPKNKKEIVKQVVEIFEIDKKSAEQALSGMPLVLVDNLTFGLAVRIKSYFQKLGAVAETSNHDMVKKNCYQIVWPEVPDLAFFIKDETTSQDIPIASVPLTENAKIDHAPVVPTASSSVLEMPSVEKMAPDNSMPSQPSKEDWDLKSPAKELLGNAQKIQSESVPSQIPQKAASDQLSKEGDLRRVQETLEKEIREKEFLEDECNDLRIRSLELESRVRELESSLEHRTIALEALTKEKEALAKQHDHSGEHLARMQELDKAISMKEKEIEAQRTREKAWTIKEASMASTIAEKQKALEVLQGELTALQNHEKEILAQIHAAEFAAQEKVKALEVVQNELATLHDKEKELSARNQTLELAAQEKEKVLNAIQNEWAVLREKEKELSVKIQMLEASAQDKEKALENTQKELVTFLGKEKDLTAKLQTLELAAKEKDDLLMARDAMVTSLEQKVAELNNQMKEFETIQQEYARLNQERETIRTEYEQKFAEQEKGFAMKEEEHRRYRSRVDRRNAAAIREIGEWRNAVDLLRQNLHKLTLFLGNASAEPGTEKKTFPRTISINRSLNQNGPGSQP